MRHKGGLLPTPHDFHYRGQRNYPHLEVAMRPGEYALFLANYTNEEQPWEFRGRNGTLPKHSYAKIAF